MKEKDIINNNKLIAEFMGHKVSKDHAEIQLDKTYEEVNRYWTKHKHKTEGDIYTTGKLVPVNGLKYHKSWDMLIPVVKKIQQMAHDDVKNEIRHRYEYNHLIIKLKHLDIDYLYKAVLEFIYKTTNGGRSYKAI